MNIAIALLLYAITVTEVDRRTLPLGRFWNTVWVAGGLIAAVAVGALG